MQNDSENNFIYSQGVTEFITISAEFCLFVEKALTIPPAEFLDKTRKILSLLYLKGSLFPKTDYQANDEIETFVTEEDWYFVHDSIQKQLGPFDVYKDIQISEATGNPEIVTSSISEDIADIYQDIKNFISLVNMGTEDTLQDAVGECTINFEEFWGQKTVRALKAIHIILLDPAIQELPTDSTPDNPEEKDTSDWFITRRQTDINNTNLN